MYIIKDSSFYFNGTVKFRYKDLVDLESLVPHHCGFESCQGIWFLTCKEAIQLRLPNFCGSTRVPARAWNNAPTAAPEVFFHQKSWKGEIHVLHLQCWWDVNFNQKKYRPLEIKTTLAIRTMWLNIKKQFIWYKS